MDPRAAFRSLLPDTPPEEIQRQLEQVHRRYGLPAAMQCLFDFELAAGYLTREKLEEVERLSFPDSLTGVRFRIQVNFARSKYRPPAQPDPKTGPDPAAGSEAAPGSPVQACPLCKSNIGRPGKERLRIYDFLLRPQRSYFVQLTPFPLYPYHFVLVLSEHRPQSIDGQSLPDMFAFLRQAPGYTICSNSDVEWAGSSILEHLHFQVFLGLHLPVMDARSVPEHTVRLNGCSIEPLDYPLSALRLSCGKPEPMQELGSRLIELWKRRDPGRNTVNLVLFRGPPHDEEYRLTILLRNPDFRTPPELRRFKGEGVGVIEASGEGILPVPGGEDAEELWRQIRLEGLAIVKGIIRGNSPALSDRDMMSLISALR